jgi:hypothetical protein
MLLYITQLLVLKFVIFTGEALMDAKLLPGKNETANLLTLHWILNTLTVIFNFGASSSEAWILMN